jgi:protein-L-isoaspartate(D-aspartate) O-methyltransferase
MGAADRARARLVAGLRSAGRVRSAAIEEAFRTVPRHVFLPRSPLGRAYADEAVPVQALDGVTTSSASQPSMMAIMLEQLDLRPGHRVLEIGAGTGYNAALMAHIVGPGGRVVSVDIDADLVARAAEHLAAAGDAVDPSRIDLVCADGALGHPPEAPYDRIVLTVGAGDVRPEWVTQLVPGGRLLLPLSVRGTQLSVALDLGPDGVLRSDSVRGCAFVRLRGVAAEPEWVTVGPGTAPGVQVVDERVPDPRAAAAVAAAALAAPGASHPTRIELGPGDLWDGFGLWLALAEPGACRVVSRDPDPAGPARELLPAGLGRATVALLSPVPPRTAANGGGSPASSDDAVEPGAGGPGRPDLGASGARVDAASPVRAADPSGAGSSGPDGVASAAPGPSGLAAVVLAPGARDDRPGPWPVAVRAFGPAGPAAVDRLVATLDAWQAAGSPTAEDIRLTVVPRSGRPAPSAAHTFLVQKQHCRVLVRLPHAGEPGR